MRPRFLYFSLFTVYTAAGRFMAVFLSERGLNNAQIGWVLGSRAVVNIIFTPCFTALADRLSSQRKILLVVVPFIAIFFAFFLPVANVETAAQFRLGGASRLGYCWAVYVATTICLSPTSPLIDALTMNWLSLHASEDGAGQYGKERLWGAISWGIFNLGLGAVMDYTGTWVMIILMEFAVIMLWLILFLGAWEDTRVHSLLPNEESALELELSSYDIHRIEAESISDNSKCENNENYVGGKEGKNALNESIQRRVSKMEEEAVDVYEATSKPPVGTNYKRVSKPGESSAMEQSIEKVSTASDVDAKGSSLPHHDSCIRVTSSPRDNETLESMLGGDEDDDGVEGEAANANTEKGRFNYKAALCMLCQSKEVVAFYLCCVTMGFGMSLVESFLFLFLTQKLGSSLLICGISVVVTVLFEIPLFMVTDRLLSTCGIVVMIIVAQGSYAIRVFGYTLVSNAWMILAFEPLHGVTYACMKTAQVNYTSFVVARPGLESTAQGLTTVMSSMGTILGQWIGGWILEVYGPSVLYRGAGLVVLASSLVLVLVNACKSGGR
mmetsp:Transcript_14709/g.35887  ORF Transcript_14709/g.35887 Transcript_14709/m.35887 type:complete len:554 (-) Transcript_14709:138-1799(-)